MKISALELKSFGSFTDVVLDFSRPARGLHMVFGRNEAGKSTALRAIRGLLYGIPLGTRDAYVHRELKVGARLVDSHGESLTVVRRKGRKNTLLDASGRPLDEAALQRMLGGLDEPSFASMFGLSQETLRTGADALLRGKGSVGESLFDAGLGGRGVHELLGRLELEARELFRPKSTNAKINAALDALKKAERDCRDHSRAPEAWVAQNAALEEAEREASELKEARDQAKLEALRLGRIARALPIVARRKELLERHVHTGAQAALLDLPKEQIDELRIRLERHRKAGFELERIREDEDERSASARAIARRLHRPTSLEELKVSRFHPTVIARARELAFRHGGVAERHAAATRAYEDEEKLVLAGRAELAARTDVPDTTELARAVERARGKRDLDAQLRRAAAEKERLEKVVARKLSGLRPWSRSIQDLLAAPLPLPESVRRFELRWQELERRTHDLEANIERLDAVCRDLERQQQELQAGGNVPSEAQLEQARCERDAQWKLVREDGLSCLHEAIEGLEERALAYDAFERSLHESDHVADRLRRESGRVATLATLLSQQEAVRRELALKQTEREEARAARSRLDDEWVQVWSASGIAPLSPAEMHAWLERCAQVVEDFERLETKAAEHEEIARERNACLDALVAASSATGMGETRGAAFAEVLDAAEERLRLAQRALQRYEDTERSLALRTRSMDALVSQATEARRQLDEWKEQWGSVLAALALPSSASTVEVMALLEDFARLDDLLDALQKCELQRAEHEREARKFEVDVAKLVNSHAPDLADHSPVDAAELLSKRAADARKEHDELAGIEQELLVVGKGMPIEALIAETVDVDIDACNVRSEELERQIEELEEQMMRARDSASALREGLKTHWLAGSSSAAEAFEDAQAHAARVQRATERYVRVRLASVLLEREIARYREEHQGPVVARTSVLFPRFTDGEYAGVRVELDGNDEFVLRCVRHNGVIVDVDALSDGARDQLYLALRLASLERLMQKSEPVPLVLDDVLIHFDEDRVAAALSALAEFGKTTQVLYFTHSQRHVELARRVIPEDALAVHEIVRERQAQLSA